MKIIEDELTGNPDEEAENEIKEENEKKEENEINITKKLKEDNLTKGEEKASIDTVKKGKNEIQVKKEDKKEVKIKDFEEDQDDMKNEIYKIKINKLEQYIKELELKIKEKDKIINEEKIINNKLSKEIKELQKTSNINTNINYIKELENEINLFKVYYKFSEGEKLISINFISVNQDINFNIISKNTEKFSKIENILYDKYPKYVESENYFLVNGNRINKYKTLKDNEIKNNDVITLEVINF